MCSDDARLLDCSRLAGRAASPSGLVCSIAVAVMLGKRAGISRTRTERLRRGYRTLNQHLH